MRRAWDFGPCWVVPPKRHDQRVNDSTVIQLSRALGDPVRFAIVSELRGGTRCACVLADVAGVSPSLLSHHLKTLRDVGLVTSERRGRWIDYTLSPAVLDEFAESVSSRAVLV